MARLASPCALTTSRQGRSLRSEGCGPERPAALLWTGMVIRPAHGEYPGSSGETRARASEIVTSRADGS